MANQDDYWRFLAQAILQQSQTGSAQAMQVAQMNMALEDQRTKAQQYQQDLELRRQQLDQSKAESQARIAEATTARNKSEFQLQRDQEAAMNEDMAKDAYSIAHQGRTYEQDALDAAAKERDQKLALGSENINLTRAQAKEAAFKAENAPAAFQYEMDARNAQIDESRSRTALAQNEDARKAQLHSLQIEDAKFNSGVNKAKWDRQIQDWAYADLHRGLSPAEDAQLNAHVSATMYPHIISFTQNMMAMGKKDPEIRAALDFVNDISKTAIQAKAIEVMDPVIGGKLKGNLEALAGQDLDPYEKYKQQKAMIAGAREEMKAKAESQPTGPDSQPTGAESRKVSLMPDSRPLSEQIKAKEAERLANRGKQFQTAEEAKRFASTAEKEANDRIESLDSTEATNLEAAYAADTGDKVAPSRDKLLKWLMQWDSPSRIIDFAAAGEPPSKFPRTMAERESDRMAPRDKFGNVIRTPRKISLTESRPTSRPDSR